jgi:hypothetical protein
VAFRPHLTTGLANIIFLTYSFVANNSINIC